MIRNQDDLPFNLHITKENISSILKISIDSFEKIPVI